MTEVIEQIEEVVEVQQVEETHHVDSVEEVHDVESIAETHEVQSVEEVHEVLGIASGPKGAPGEGMPAGGDAGDALIKGSDDDYDLEWKERQYTHEQAVPSDTWVIEHNMGIKPHVLIMNSAGERVYGWEEHPTVDKCILRWDAAFSGTAYLS